MDVTRLVSISYIFSEIVLQVNQRVKTQNYSARSKGISAALMSAVFLGITPVLGKAAILNGAPPLAVVAFRTFLAATLLFLAMLIFYRRYLYIYPAGFIGCLLAGGANGLGSLFYYNALGHIDAGLGHLLYSMYPLFLVLWLLLDRQKPSQITLLRLLLAIPAIFLLTQSGAGHMNIIGVIMMLIASALYALHIPINQRVLYDMPAQTVTLYTLIAMSVVVTPVYLVFGSKAILASANIWWPIIGLTLVTFISRLMLFLGVKHLGGMQTALLGLSELLVALAFAHIFLGERFTPGQWVGAIILIISLMMVVVDKSKPKSQHSGGWLSWLSPPKYDSSYPWQHND